MQSDFNHHVIMIWVRTTLNPEKTLAHGMFILPVIYGGLPPNDPRQLDFSIIKPPFFWVALYHCTFCWLGYLELSGWIFLKSPLYLVVTNPL